MEKIYSLEEAFDYCMNLAQRHYENFPVASLVIPSPLRPYVASVYAFARTADDFADEKEFDGSRMALLVQWEQELKSLPHKEPIHPVLKALKKTIEDFHIPLTLFENLITAFKMDVAVSRYETFEQVLGYCRYSANPIGRIILHLFGYPAPKFLEYSDAICTALQLANFWQDVTLDLEKKRIYIPQEDFLRFRYSESELEKRIYNENFKRLILFQVERTQGLFDRGRPLCAKIPGRLGLELRMTWLGGTRILQKITEAQGDVLKHRPFLTKKDIFGMIWNGLLKKGF